MDAGPPRRRKPVGGTGKGKAKQGSTEWARKRTRNIERLMKRSTDMPANVRNEMERELAAHRQTIGDKAFQRKRSAMISKYHMVRFFERKKAARLAKQLRRQIEAEEDEEKKAALQKELHIAEVDEAYTINYPHIEAYISLYGGKKKDDDDDDAEKTPAAKIALSADRPEMWYTIEKAMTKGHEALRQIREKRGENDVPEDRSAPHPSRAALISNNPQHDWKTSGRAKEGEQPEFNRRERRKRMREAIAAGAKGPDDNENNGAGFFDL